MTKILVTGVAGFIGFHLAHNLLTRGEEVIGIDNLNDYYDVNLKKDRLAKLETQTNFQFHQLDLADTPGISNLFTAVSPEKVAHLAAQAGVRYSLTNPHAYINSNIVGTMNILEGCRHSKIQHLVFASSSSIYGANRKQPFAVTDNVDHPVSLYAATKKSNELMIHSYSHLYQIPATCLRFFTVYGPWGRPDMALFLFTKAILAGKPIDVFNYGKMRRDFTYIDDIIEGVVRIIDKTPQPNPNWSAFNPEPGSSYAPYKIYNIGNNQPVELLTFIEVLEASLGKKALKNMLPLQLEDVPETYADIEELTRDTGFKPQTPIEVGIPLFVEWYRSYYHQL
ncbi:MAG: NAD-dependent epimerase [Gomphosphaeria aponina SAG 52.96 = DSM 107014]|uniref:NAD-dependent epimerase n=1 Tax=Gomphosphaeria aponina SAG 52.96 = DSM 107014 TaxID=1521640 RepID=A0A941GTR8_9CHRO|nr:NAD-dependent epimerase [Gomphosphaeria aponina SAG 52.96 = DSM 107014]